MMMFFTLCKHTLQQTLSVYSSTAARDHRGYPMNHPSRVSLRHLSTVVNWRNRQTYYGRSEEAKCQQGREQLQVEIYHFSREEERREVPLNLNL
jgi:hypothetical protein